MSKYYTETLFDFLSRLSTNNNRDWFRENKQEYDMLRTLWLADVDRMIAHMSSWDARLSSATAKNAAYRIYRDTRFSPDKTPFKTYFSAAVSDYGRSSAYAGYYLQMGPGDGCGLYGGVWCPDAQMLKKLRHAIVDNIEEWDEINADAGLNRHFQLITSSSLRTIPKGWPKDHPQAAWLRMKDYGRMAQLSPDFFFSPDWPVRAAELFRLVKPFNDFLNYSIDE